jgi:hypothetical protein
MIIKIKGFISIHSYCENLSYHIINYVNQTKQLIYNRFFISKIK